jgi:hypothetical protein
VEDSINVDLSIAAVGDGFFGGSITSPSQVQVSLQGHLLTFDQVSVENSLSANGRCFISGSISSTESSQLGKSLSIRQWLSGGYLSVSDKTRLVGSVSVCGSGSVDGDISVASSSVEQGIRLNGASGVIIKNSLSVRSDFRLGEDSSTTHHATVRCRMIVKDDSILKGTLTIFSAGNPLDPFKLLGALDLDDSLSVSGLAHLGSDLSLWRTSSG